MDSQHTGHDYQLRQVIFTGWLSMETDDVSSGCCTLPGQRDELSMLFIMLPLMSTCSELSHFICLTHFTLSHRKLPRKLENCWSGKARCRCDAQQMVAVHGRLDILFDICWLGRLVDLQFDGHEFSSQLPHPVLGWVTVFRWAHHPGQLSLLPSTRQKMSTSQSAVMLCG